MIEEDLTLKEPKALMKWLGIFWVVIGFYACTWSEDGQNNFKNLKKTLSKEYEGIDYSKSIIRIAYSNNL